MATEVKEAPSDRQVAKAFLLGGEGRLTAPDVRFEERFTEPAIRLVLTHGDAIEEVRAWRILMIQNMALAITAAKEDPNPTPGVMDMRTLQFEGGAWHCLKEALSKIRDSREVSGEDRLAASDLLGDLQ